MSSRVPAQPSLSAAIPQATWEGSQDARAQGPDDDREVACEDEGGREPEEDDDKSD